MNPVCRSLEETVSALLRILAWDRKTSPEEGVEYFFRGEACNYANPGSSELDTAFDSFVDRDEGHRKHERQLYEDAMRLNVASFGEDRTMTERVARMQHYGLPTRFADLSENALQAVCFAVGGGSGDAAKHAEEDGFIRIIKVSPKKMKSFTSDIIIAISHLPLVDWDRIKIAHGNGQKSDLGYLTYEIKRERPGFVDAWEDPDLGLDLQRELQQVWAFRPIVNSPRLRNQGGVFLAFGCRNEKEPLKPSFSPADYGDGSKPSWGIAQVGFVRIDAKRKRRILEELRWFGMQEERVFPELADVCRVLEKRYKETKSESK